MTKLTDEELNKRIHEIMGLCRHEGPSGMAPSCMQGVPYRYCMKCSKPVQSNYKPNNFTGSWQTSAYEFGLMWEFMQKHESGISFIDYLIPKCFESNTCSRISWLYQLQTIISPRPFAKAMVEFFDSEKEE